MLDCERFYQWLCWITLCPEQQIDQQNLLMIKSISIHCFLLNVSTSVVPIYLSQGSLKIFDEIRNN